MPPVIMHAFGQARRGAGGVVFKPLEQVFTRPVFGAGAPFDHSRQRHEHEIGEDHTIKRGRHRHANRACHAACAIGQRAKAAKRQNTTPILYLTAPYSLNKEPVKEPMEPERALKETRIAADIAKKTGAIVVPVPLAIYRLQKAGIPIVLGYKNDIHPNQTCAYLTACICTAPASD